MEPYNDGLPDDLTTPEAAEILQRQEMIKALRSDIARGLYSPRLLRQKYGKHFNQQEMEAIVEGLIEQIAAENVVDIRMEIIGFLLSSEEFQRTLYTMMEKEKDAGRTRNVVEIVKLLSTLKNDRLAFIKEIGIPIAMYNEGDRTSLPDKVDLGKLLAAGQEALKHAKSADSRNYAGKLSNGREGDASGELEGEQISLYPTSPVS